MNGTTTSQTAWIRPCTRVWLLLMALSLVTFLVGWMQLQGLAAALTVLGFALLKGLLIGDWYMGLRWVDGLWRWVIVLWLLVPGALITLAFALAARGSA